jgi:hypothetical protein
MFVHHLSSTAGWNKARFRVPLKQASRLFVLLVFLFTTFGGATVRVHAAGTVTLDGAVSSASLASGTSISFNHTTGTGADRLMLVGVSWNSGTTARTISSVTFTPSGGSAIPLNSVITQQAGTQFRYSAIYSLLDPPNGQVGTVAITFSGSVSNGMMAGAANFTGVNQSTPLGTPGGVGPTAQGTAPSVTLTGLDGNELVFDNVFQGASASTQTLTVASDQTQLWNPAYVANLRAGASLEQATTSSVTMSWTAASASYWSIAAVPIKPAAIGPTHSLTIAKSGTGSGTVTPDVGLHSYSEGTIVTLLAGAATGSTFNGWSGDIDCADGSVTMDADKTCTADFSLNQQTLSFVAGTGGTVTAPSGTSPQTYGYGSIVTITASPNSGYHFTNWSGDVGTVANVNATSTTITMNGDYSITANFAEGELVALDGAVSSNTTASGTSISFAHTTGTGSNRLMLVGISWNPNSAASNITSVTFTPTGGSAIDLSQVITRKHSTQNRYSSIYGLLNPPSGQAGTVTVNFGATVSAGIMAGAANFAGVDQATPFGATNSAEGQSTAASVILTGLNGDELIFDNVFQGASSSSQSLTVGSGQAQLWNPAYVANLRAAASIEQAMTSSVTMSWTTASSSYWVIVAVPIHPGGADTTSPTVTINQAAGQSDLTTVSPINFTVEFSEPVTDFVTGDVNLSGTAGATTAAVTGSGTNYNVAVSGMTDSGTVIASIAAGAAHDAAGNPSAASTSSDDSVTFVLDITNPTVTINQAAGQSDPTSASPINFTVEFSEPVTDFVTGDVSLSGTAGPATALVTSSGTNYNVAVSGMTDSGTVIASIAAGAAHDAAGNPSAASTSSDDSVIYNKPAAVTVEGTASTGTGAPAASSVTFSHTTGTRTNRLMLVGVSWNCGTTDQTISSATFTPSGGNAISLNLVKTQQYTWTTNNYRYTAIYSLLNPPSEVTGAVNITFTGAVSNGIIAGAANFAGVDPTSPLGTPDGAVGTGSSTSGTPNPAVTLTDLTGNELVFDSVFIGASSTSHTISADSGQSALWNINGYPSSSSFNALGAASTEQATGASVNMSWTTVGYSTTTTRWAIAAVPIHPAPITSPCYALTLSHSGNGSDPTASPLKSDACAANGQYVAGEPITLTATPDPGWQIGSWTGTDGPSLNSLTMPASAHTALVTYTQNTYTLTITSDHGTVAKNPDKATYTYGEVVQLTATSTPGWSFDHWSGDAAGTANLVSVTMNGNKTVTANYSLVTFYFIITSDHGTVTKSPDKATYNYGDIVQLTATPAIGWAFTNWSGDVTSTSNPISVVMDSTKTITANFAIDTHTLTIFKAGTGSGSVTPAVGEHSYNYGAVVTLEGTADPGSTFEGWSGNTDCADGSVTMDADKACTATFSIIPVNDPPVVSNIPDQTISEGAFFTPIQLDDFVSDVDNADTELTWTYTGNSQLTVSITNRVATISIPDVNWNGAETITFRATDPGGLHDEDAATFTVTAVNDDPVITGANPTSVTMSEDSSPTPFALTLNATDVDNPGSALTWSIATPAAHGSGTASGTGYSKAVGYIPLASYSGSDSFVVQVSDGSGGTDTITVNVTIEPVNDPPVVSNISDQTIAEGASFATIHLDDFVSDVDNTDAEITWTYSGNSQLTVSINNRVATIGIPSEDWNGAETITFRATDPGALYDDDTATFSVTTGNDPPVVSNIPDQTISEGASFTTVNLDNFVSDVDNTDAEMNWTYSGNSQLMVSINNRLATIGIPDANWTGTETITFTATDPGLLSDSDSATFTVTGVNDPPVVSGIPDQTIAEGASFATIHLDNYVTDVDNPDAEMTWTYSGNAQLSVSITDRVATIHIPSANWHGSETITFRATDSGGLYAEDTATFTVTQTTFTHSISLIQGWNLISFNLHPTNTDIAAVLTSIAGKYDLVYAWDATGSHSTSGNWVKYSPTAPGYSNTLSELNETMGFWIHMTAAGTLDITGSAPATTTIALQTNAGGWNLVAYPSAINRSLPEALSDHGVGTDFSLVYAYHANDGSDQWKLFDRNAPIWSNDLSDLTPGWGYWIHVNVNHSWDVVYQN